MTQQMVVYLGQTALQTAFLMAAPMLGVGLLVGLIIGIFQAVTNVQEITLTFVPKMIAVMATLAFTLPWLMQIMLSYTYPILNNLAEFAK